jgi:hypothetical protein
MSLDLVQPLTDILRGNELIKDMSRFDSLGRQERVVVFECSDCSGVLVPRVCIRTSSLGDAYHGHLGQRETGV